VLQTYRKHANFRLFGIYQVKQGLSGSQRAQNYGYSDRKYFKSGGLARMPETSYSHLWISVMNRLGIGRIA